MYPLRIAFLALATLAASGETGHSTSLLQPIRTIGAPPAFVSACHRYQWLCSNRPGRSMADVEALALLTRVNSEVNSAVRPADDRSTTGKEDDWSLPVAGKGDCEDYALMKKKRLIDAGFRSDHLALTVVLDRSGGNHVVLMARVGGGDYVLDNLAGSVRSWEKTGYTFVARQSFENKRIWQVILAGPHANPIAAADRRAGHPA